MSWAGDQPSTILVIDDDLDGREMVRWVLRKAGHAVRDAGTIAAARDLLDGVDLAVIDVNLPDGNGLELTRSLREDPRYSRMAILQTSALAIAPRQQAAGLDSGADAYLVHPVEPLVLSSTVSALLRLRRVERDLAERDRQLRQALEAGGVTVVRIDLVSGTVTGIDGQLERMGVAPGPQHHLEEFVATVHTDDQGMVREALLSVGTGRSEEFECRLLPPGKPMRRLLVRIAPLEDFNSRPVVAHATLVDVTSRRALQQQVTTIDNLLDRVSTAIELQDLANLTIPEVRAAWLADVVTLSLMVEGEDRAQVYASDGWDRWDLPGPVMSIGEGVVSRALFAGAAEWTTAADVTADDQRFVGPGVDTVAVAPIRTGDRGIVGFIALGFHARRELNGEELQLLTLLGSRLGGPIRRAQTIADERELVVVLQQQLLPERIDNPAGLTVVGRYAAGALLDVGGDWYDCIELADGSTVLIVGDVTGKGPSAAVVMGRVRAFAAALADRCDGPGELLAAINLLLCRDHDAHMATVCCLHIAPDRTSGRLALAGHPPPLLLTGSPVGTNAGATTSLESTYLSSPPGPPLGAISDAHYHDRHVDLSEAWTVVLYTDGLIERRESDLDTGFALLNLRAGEVCGAPVEEMADRLLRVMVPTEVHDDVALLIARRQG